MTFGRYGKKSQLEKQFQIVSKVQIGGLSC
jgi:hypothetical protein